MAAPGLDAAAIQQLMQNTVQAALQAVQPQQQQPQQQQAANPAFSLEPESSGNAPWDFTKGDGLKLFIHGTKSLENRFNGKQD